MKKENSQGLKKARFYIYCRIESRFYKVRCDGYYFEYKDIKLGIHKGYDTNLYVISELSTGRKYDEYDHFPTKKELKKAADYIAHGKGLIPYEKYINQFSAKRVRRKESLKRWSESEIEIDLTLNKM